MSQTQINQNGHTGISPIASLHEEQRNPTPKSNRKDGLAAEPTNLLSPETLRMGMTPMQRFIFGSRLILVVLYLGLILAGGAYSARFCLVTYEFLLHFWKIDNEEVLLTLIRLVDMVMIANLVMMIVIGSYYTFVAELKFQHKDMKPQWLDHMTPGALKVKMGSSLIGVSSIHLLQAFINSEHTDWNNILKKCSIHLLFVASTMALAGIDKATGHSHGS